LLPSEIEPKGKCILLPSEIEPKGKYRDPIKDIGARHAWPKQGFWLAGTAVFLFVIYTSEFILTFSHFLFEWICLLPILNE
jgi:hypothetical protein